MDLSSSIKEICLHPDGRLKRTKIRSDEWWSSHESLQTEINNRTSYLPNETDIEERIYHILHDYTSEDIVWCSCGRRSKFTWYEGYRKYCGGVCAAKSPERREKTKRTCLQKYGVDNPSKSADVIDKIRSVKIEKYGSTSYNNREKARETCMDLYGVDNPSKSAEVHAKKQVTLHKNYGVTAPLQSEIIRERAKETCKERYGSEYYARTEDFDDKYRKTCLERYGVDHFSKTGEFSEKSRNTRFEKYGEWFNNREKTKATCLDLYGVDHASKRPGFRDSLIKTRLRTGTSPTTEVILEMYDKYIRGDSVFRLELEYGYSVASIYRYFDLNSLPLTPRKVTYPHQILLNSLEEYSYIVNDREILDGKEIDILIPELKVGIEVDGLYWHSHNNTTTNRYHREKVEKAAKKGVRLLRFTDDEILNKKDIVMSILNCSLGKSAKIPARKCRIVKVDKPLEKDFLSENHLSGFTGSKECYGLEYNGSLIYVISFGAPRFSKEYEWEIIRSASKLNTVIVGGFSKVLKHFEALHSPKSILSYVDRRYFSGSSYKKTEFECKGYTDVGYHYYKDGVLYNRIKFQKHKLSGLLSIFDPKKTEKENMLDNGYRIYYDCGHLIFVKESAQKDLMQDTPVFDNTRSGQDKPKFDRKNFDGFK